MSDANTGYRAPSDAAEPLVLPRGLKRMPRQKWTNSRPSTSC